MNAETGKVMFALLRSAVCGNRLSDEEIALYRSDRLPEIVFLSELHDVVHLLVLGLKKNGLLDENSKKLEGKMLAAVYRYERLHYELTKLCAALEQAAIPFMPLKGAVMRQYYPEPWMRTSCDMDVLVHEDDLEKAASYLTDQLGYTRKSQNSHDISMFTQGSVHVELHYHLIENGRVRSAAAVLKPIWNVAVKHDGCTYQYGMPDEMFYFYHIAHMAKHFENGGCGIRPFLDIWVLNHRVDFDREKREKLLADGGLTVFAKRAELLSEVWFGKAEHTEITKQIEAYILRGGVYGTNTNRITVQQQKQGGKCRYVLSKIFIPYEVIKFHYPILQKHKWLTPIMEVRRWGKLIFCGHLRRTTKELKYNNAVSKDVADQTKALLKNMGL